MHRLIPSLNNGNSKSATQSNLQSDDISQQRVASSMSGTTTWPTSPN